MTKNLKLALLPAAITAAMFSNSALAGTEACFEVYRGDASSATARISDFHVLFDGANCGTTTRNADLATLDPARVAYELTGGNDLELNDANNAGTAINVVYVPTTNLPTGTFIEMNLSENAVFGANGDQLYLIKRVRDNEGATDEYVTVASTTGATDDQGNVTFVVNSNAVEAGQRLVLSSTSQIVDQTDITSPVVRMNNEGCPVDANITIDASATYNDVALIGSQTDDSTVIVEAERQFKFAQGVNIATNPVVNSDADNLRTNFVITVDGSNNYITNVSSDHAVFERAFLNEANRTVGTPLDQFVTLTAADTVGMNLRVEGNSPTSTVEGNFYTNDTTDGVSIIDQSVEELLTNEAQVVDIKSSTNNSIAYDGASDTYSLNDGNLLFDADEIFRNGFYSTSGAFRINNINETTAMAYNYDLYSDFGLFFNDADARKLLNQSYACNAEVHTHNVDVNGAVIKVPYAYNAGGNWVRITNEFSQPATVTVEVIDENDSAGALYEPRVLELSEANGFDTLNEYDSVIYKVPEIMTLARRTFGLDHSTRVSLTFTVTAPKNTVHAVSVLNTGGGVDRTMPVLDQNDWSE